jgi:hypothetical protein
MAITQITLNFDDMNISAQVGDIIYYSTGAAPLGGFNHTHLHNTHKLGPIIEIDGGSITVEYDDSLVDPPPGDSFISTDKIELFSVGSEISQSSE